MELGKRHPSDLKRLERLPDKTVERTSSLSLDADMLRWEREGEEWVFELNDYAPGSYVAVFDGEVGKCLYGADRLPKPRYPGVGIIRKEARHPNSSSYSIMPLLLAYRAARANLGDLSAEKLSISTRTGAVDGRSCLIVNSPSGGSGTTAKGPRTYWVDPQRDYVVLRMTEASLAGNAHLVVKLDVSYQRDGLYGWYPAGWTCVSLLSNGHVGFQFTGRVTKYQINPEIPHGEFELDFPPGTRVADWRHGSSEYIVKESGANRVISRAELNAGIPYDQLAATETDETISKTRRVTRILLASATVLAIVTFVTWLRVRRAQRSLERRFPRIDV